MRVFAPKDGGNVSIGGVTIKVVDGQVDVDGPIAAQLVEQFAFTYEPPGTTPAATAATSPAGGRVLVFPNTWSAEQIEEFRRQFEAAVAHGDLPPRVRPPEPLAPIEQQPAPAPQTPAAETSEPSKVETPIETHNE